MSALQYPLICFDLDGTLVDDTVYIWNTLHEGFHTPKQERKEAHDSFFAGRITYKEWFAHDLKLLKACGATRPAIVQMLRGLRPMNGAMETLQTLRHKGHRLAIVSGSLDIVLEQLFPEFVFDHVLINRLFFNENGMICGGEHTPWDVQAKADGLRELCRRESLLPEQTVFVGDNENDLWIAEAAGLAIAFNCKSRRLAQISDIEIVEKDLRAIVPHIC